MKTELIFLGAPASGKGTQTKRLSKELNIPHVDTGGMLRAAISEGTEYGMIAKSYMDKGQLVPLEIVKNIINERLQKEDCSNGFILDGYPRSVEQADALEQILSNINKDSDVKVLVINIDVNQDIIIERIVNRRMCKGCGKIYNLKFIAPKVENVCDDCSSELYQRPDDVEETALNRLDTYNKQTEPLIEYYSKKVMLANVDGNGSVDSIYSKILEIVNN